MCFYGIKALAVSLITPKELKFSFFQEQKNRFASSIAVLLRETRNIDLPLWPVLLLENAIKSLFRGH